MDRSTYPTKGYITLLSMIVAGAVAVALTTAIMLSSVNSSKISLSAKRSIEAISLAGSCAQESLEKIRNNNSFGGPGTITTTNGSCSYQIINLGGEDREIRATANVNSTQAQLRVVIDAITPLINIARWEEVVEF